MKQFFSYNILIIALVLGIASVSAIVWEKNETHNNQVVNNEDNASSTGSNYFFNAQNSPYICNALYRSNARTQPAVMKVSAELRDLRVSCNSQLTTIQLYTTKSLYVSFYAEKQMRGYYIYALRKLLI